MARSKRVIAIPEPILPEYPKGSVTVSFKHEGDVRGQKIGPVAITHRPTYDAWCKANDAMPVASRLTGETNWAIPFGSHPEGLHRMEGWFTRAGAAKIAKHYGVTLEES